DTEDKVDESSEPCEKAEERVPELRIRKQSDSSKDAESNEEFEEFKKPKDNIWLYLLRAAGVHNVLLFIILQTSHYAFQSARSIYVASWSDSEESS
ncbi:hypothetical protein PMAYCL1PPCAC_27671, partial [Pristionchus mayeri]